MKRRSGRIGRREKEEEEKEETWTDRMIVSWKRRERKEVKDKS